MSNLTITNNDMGGVVYEAGDYSDETYTAAGAGTTPAGTILARITATGKVVDYDPAGAAGAEIPKLVLTYPVVAAGAGDIAIRALKSGKVVQEDLIVTGVGDPTVAELDQLRDFTLISKTVQELNILDNQ